MVYTVLVPVIVGSGDLNAYPSSTVSDFTVELADALLLHGEMAMPSGQRVVPQSKLQVGDADVQFGHRDDAWGTRR